MRRIWGPDTEYGKTWIAGQGPFLYDPALVPESGLAQHGLQTDKDAIIDELQENTKSLSGVTGAINRLEARVAALEQAAS